MLLIESGLSLGDAQLGGSLMDFISQADALEEILLLFDDSNLVILEGIHQQVCGNGDVSHLLSGFQISQDDAEEHILPGGQSRSVEELNNLLI